MNEQPLPCHAIKENSKIANLIVIWPLIINCCHFVPFQPIQNVIRRKCQKIRGAINFFMLTAYEHTLTIVGTTRGSWGMSWTVPTDESDSSLSSAELDEVDLPSSCSISSNCILEEAEFTGVGGVLEMSLLLATLDTATNSSEGRKSSGCNRRLNALPHDGYQGDSFRCVVMNLYCT